tara:strand:+ start:439 stop:648 length:210 start_codon:yes stop_codon:yes gene_type:complete
MRVVAVGSPITNDDGFSLSVSSVSNDPGEFVVEEQDKNKRQTKINMDLEIILIMVFRPNLLERPNSQDQ